MNTITERDNAMIEQYVKALKAAEDDLVIASEEYQAANNAPMGIDSTRSLEAAGALDDAYSAYSKASNQLAQHIASLWRSGYRLTRN